METSLKSVNQKVFPPRAIATHKAGITNTKRVTLAVKGIRRLDTSVAIIIYWQNLK
ncbi:MAG: hypothetical protein KME54_24360 [Tolypothrix brevis GSE-NOS-MK-07-07A]|nr:hypothetical protein [Tolypothrix brevis GSE-NOS-MK-07-07A]